MNWKISSLSIVGSFYVVEIKLECGKLPVVTWLLATCLSLVWWKQNYRIKWNPIEFLYDTFIPSFFVVSKWIKIRMNVQTNKSFVTLWTNNSPIKTNAKRELMEMKSVSIFLYWFVGQWKRSVSLGQNR